MRAAWPGSAWLVRLMLAWGACAFCAGVGLVQPPAIVNRAPILLGPPIESTDPTPAVLEFPARKPAENSRIVYVTEELVLPQPASQTLNFTAKKTSVPEARQVLLFDALPSFPSIAPATIFQDAPTQKPTEDDRRPPWMPAVLGSPIFEPLPGLGDPSEPSESPSHEAQS